MSDPIVLLNFRQPAWSTGVLARIKPFSVSTTSSRDWGLQKLDARHTLKDLATGEMYFNWDKIKSPGHNSGLAVPRKAGLLTYGAMVRADGWFLPIAENLIDNFALIRVRVRRQNGSHGYSLDSWRTISLRELLPATIVAQERLWKNTGSIESCYLEDSLKVSTGSLLDTLLPRKQERFSYEEARFRYLELISAFGAALPIYEKDVLNCKDINGNPVRWKSPKDHLDGAATNRVMKDSVSAGDPVWQFSSPEFGASAVARCLLLRRFQIYENEPDEREPCLAVDWHRGEVNQQIRALKTFCKVYENGRNLRFDFNGTMFAGAPSRDSEMSSRLAKRLEASTLNGGQTTPAGILGAGEIQAMMLLEKFGIQRMSEQKS